MFSNVFYHRSVYIALPSGRVGRGLSLIWMYSVVNTEWC